MAKTTATIDSIKTILSEREDKFNKRTIVRFKFNDEVKLVVNDEGSVDARETGFTPKDGEPVLKYKFLLKRGGAQFPVYITLGTFTSLPLAKRGFGAQDSELQRMGARNAVFADLEMRPAEDIVDALKKGVKCSGVYTTSESQSQCYRWDRL